MIPDRLNAMRCAYRCSETACQYSLMYWIMWIRILDYSQCYIVQYTILLNQTIQMWKVQSYCRCFLHHLIAIGQGMNSRQSLDCKNVQFASRPIHQPDLLLFCRPNSHLYLWSCGLCRVSLDLSVAIGGSGFQFILFIDAFKYHTANQKIVTVIYHCHFLIY
jgi:hypothetical protein